MENIMDSIIVKKKSISIRNSRSNIMNNMELNHTLHTENISAVRETNINQEETYGPQLPPHMQRTVVNPATIPDYINEEIPGPLPSTDTNNKTSSEIELSTRALKIKIKNIECGTNSELNNVTREEWMLELPEINKNKNIVDIPRSFHTKEQPDFTDRSCWTNTPHTNSDKKKNLATTDFKRKIELEKDNVYDLATKHKKTKKDKSLLELHEDKQRKERKKMKHIKSERRPFNREIDIKVNTFDQTKKSSLVNKAKLLDTKFSSGTTKYL